MRVIGTAGHVDHGKSTLVKALTGIDPDRLREEQERQMTIDLGFAWMMLPGGEEVGIIDVPGHHDFIENMLAGVGGIDAALLVIAADEGVMPQTREHLAILDLLEIQPAVVAVTKTDLVEDAAWLDLVEEEVRGLLATTRLAEVPLVRCSAVTGEGLAALVIALEDVLQASPPRRDLGRPRLPIDRAFTISGFGTVVTGTLTDGRLRVGQQVEILPQGLRARIRGLQSHKRKVEEAVPGSRVAANLSGVEVRQVRRGDVLVPPGAYRATRLLDVRFRLLPEADRPLRHHQEVKLFLGSAQRIARARVLGQDQIRPGEEGWLQLLLEAPVVAERGDHFILRRPSPPATLGGGQVADPTPSRRHRRRDVAVLARLEALLAGSPERVLEETLAAKGAIRLADLGTESGLGGASARQALTTLLQSRRAHLVGGESGWVVGAGQGQALLERARKALEQYHSAFPLRQGMPREELKSRLGLATSLFNGLVRSWAENGVLEEVGARLRLAGYRPRLSPEQQARVQRLLAAFQAHPYAPPTYKASLEQVGEELLGHLIEEGVLVQVSPEVLLSREAYQAMVARVKEELARRDTITVAEVRDLFETSRKYALALMEHLDSIGVTVREGDARRLASGGKG